MSSTAIAWLVTLVAAFLFGYHQGRLGIEVHDAREVIKQVAHNESAQKIEDSTIAIEAKAYDDLLLEPVPAPVVRLCTNARAVPASRPAALAAHAEAPGREPDQPDLIQGPDIGRPLVTAGRDADAQIAGLQDYITRVCLSAN